MSMTAIGRAGPGRARAWYVLHVTPPNKPAPALGGSALWAVSVLLRTPLLGAALARSIARDVVDARLRHPDLCAHDLGPAPLYSLAPPADSSELTPARPAETASP